VRARRRTGLLRPTQEQHKSGSRRRPTREQHAQNGIPRHTWARVLKSWCQLNYQDGCALAGLIGQYSPGGIGSDRPSEKRKVGSSTLPLTTSFWTSSSALTSANTDCALPCLQPLSDHDCPCVTVIGRSPSHADRTPCLRALGSSRETGSGCPQAGPRRAARCGACGVITQGAQLPGTGVRAGAPARKAKSNH